VIVFGPTLLTRNEIPGSQTRELPHSLDRECLVRVGANDGFGGDGPMGKMTGRESNRLTLSLVGNFRLGDPEGRPIRVTEKKARVLLAMLATARDRRRSREWLKSRLWERSFEEQASNSLRQSLHALRRALEPYADILQADYEHVWLENVDVEMDPGGDPRAAFFEDAPRLGEGGEDWLREERQAFAARQEDAPRAMVDLGPVAPVAPVVFEAAPTLLIGSPVVVSEDVRAAAVAERITNMMQETFRANGFVETYDLRDMQTNQLEGRSPDSVAHPPVLAEVRVSVVGQELQATIVARVPATGRVIWTSSIASDRDAAFSIASETMMEFVMGAVDSIEGLILRNPSLGAKPTLYTAVHQLFGLSRDGLHDANVLLKTFTGPSGYSANAEAWLAFGTMLMRNEIRERREAAVAMAGEHLAKALEADPSNAVILAIAGHYEGFILNDLATGRQHLAESRRILPNLAFAWDATAMNAIYSGDLDRGAQAADIARRLGRYSPYRFYYDASAVIAATLQGRHQDAVRLGERVLAKRPKFLPVLRHLFASYAAIGEHEKARDCFRQIRESEPSFGTPAMYEEDYARTYSTTIRLIETSLRDVGLIGQGGGPTGQGEGA
jgi:tetratricopeptide (TPR) repeat protein